MTAPRAGVIDPGPNHQRIQERVIRDDQESEKNRAKFTYLVKNVIFLLSCAQPSLAARLAVSA
jgi:hypothetical protein